MNRFSRVNTIWRKELADTLRDKRTLVAMVLVPLVLYPAMMLGSLQGFELQVSRLRQEDYKVGVLNDRTQSWLRAVLDSDPARQPGVDPNMPAEEIVERARSGELSDANVPTVDPAAPRGSPTDVAQEDVRHQPPGFIIEVIPDPNEIIQQVLMGELHVAVVFPDGFPTAAGERATPVTFFLDQTEIRSQMAAAGLEGVFERLGRDLLRQRLQRTGLDETFVTPLAIATEAVATPEKVGGSILGQIVPLILIIMTITGAIYPAIDLTAGERERGTLETLMAAPVPTVDLIAGKFIVVALIGMLSALLNLLAIGGTVFLGGLGEILSQGGEVVIPMQSLPWVLLVLIPLAVMFSAMLLAVCSFARSFKEAQNYVMPVLVAAMIPAVVGIMPGMRLEGPLLVVPVTNITILTRDLFTGRFDIVAIMIVTLSTTLYAGAAVAVAAKLFGQEAVLFADSGSFLTLVNRKFYKPSDRPGAAQAFLLLAAVFSLNFFAQQMILNRPGVFGTMNYWYGLAAILITLFVLVPMLAAVYSRVRIRPAFQLGAPPPQAWIAAVFIGCTGWILGSAWSVFQQQWLPMPTEFEMLFESMLERITSMNPVVTVLFIGALPAVCEEFFFRGYALSGLRGALGRWPAVLIVAVAFGAYHFSVHRLFVTTGLGILFGLLVIQYRSLWPAIVAHLLNNGLSILVSHKRGLQPLAERVGLVPDDHGLLPTAWLGGAAAVMVAGLLISVLWPAREPLAADRGLS